MCIKEMFHFGDLFHPSVYKITLTRLTLPVKVLRRWELTIPLSLTSLWADISILADIERCKAALAIDR